MCNFSNMFQTLHMSAIGPTSSLSPNSHHWLNCVVMSSPFNPFKQIAILFAVTSDAGIHLKKKSLKFSIVFGVLQAVRVYIRSVKLQRLVHASLQRLI